LKDILLENITLNYPNLNERFYVATDASAYSIAHCLFQKAPDGSMKLVSSGGRALLGTARQMSACDSELAVILDALQSYRHFFSSGVFFTTFTDHCSLKYLEQ
jgi:RNase H-like domain found in reverse transcriptase